MKKENKKILTKAILFIIKYSIASYFAVIMLKFIENHNFSSSISFVCGVIYIFFVELFFVIAELFFVIFDNILNAKNIEKQIGKIK
tara:strand:- start:245 stop:502 length:258 start_codon:yes stop_codon:yes gene_type:complete